MFNTQPEGSSVVIENRHRPMLVKFADGTVSTSDTWLMGTLSALGISPASDTPTNVNGRCWWTFCAAAAGSVTSVGLEYYAPKLEAGVGVNFVRRAVELARGYAQISKGETVNSNYEKGRK